MHLYIRTEIISLPIGMLSHVPFDTLQVVCSGDQYLIVKLK